MIQGTDKIQEFIRQASSLHVVNVVFFTALVIFTLFLFNLSLSLEQNYLLLKVSTVGIFFVGSLKVLMHTSSKMQKKINDDEFDLLLAFCNVSITYLLFYHIDTLHVDDEILNLLRSFLPTTLFVLIAPLTWKKHNFVYVGFFGFLEWTLFISVIVWGGLVLTELFINGNFFALLSNIVILFAPLIIRTLRRRHIENLQEKMHKELYTDPLTQVSNRKYFYDYYDKLREENKAHNIGNKGMGIIFVDIDYFKQYNDNYGHEKGDECLYGVAQFLKKEAESLGLHIFRFGGEEFLLCGVMDRACWDKKVVGSEFVKRWEDNKLFLPMEHIGSPFKAITLSGGGVFVEQQEIYENNAVGITKKADSLLYVSKENGRNTVSF